MLVNNTPSTPQVLNAEAAANSMLAAACTTPLLSSKNTSVSDPSSTESSVKSSSSSYLFQLFSLVMYVPWFIMQQLHLVQKVSAHASDEDLLVQQASLITPPCTPSKAFLLAPSSTNHRQLVNALVSPFVAHSVSSTPMKNAGVDSSQLYAQMQQQLLMQQTQIATLVQRIAVLENQTTRTCIDESRRDEETAAAPITPVKPASELSSKEIITPARSSTAPSNGADLTDQLNIINQMATALQLMQDSIQELKDENCSLQQRITQAEEKLLESMTAQARAHDEAISDVQQSTRSQIKNVEQSLQKHMSQLAQLKRTVNDEQKSSIEYLYSQIAILKKQREKTKEKCQSQPVSVSSVVQAEPKLQESSSSQQESLVTKPQFVEQINSSSATLAHAKINKTDINTNKISKGIIATILISIIAVLCKLFKK